MSMRNNLTISIYGKGKEKIYSELGQFNPSPLDSTPLYQKDYGSTQNSIVKRNALIQYLVSKKKEIPDLFFNLYFEEGIDWSDENKKQIEDALGEYFLFLPWSGVIRFVPIDYSTVCFTYFSTPAQKYVNIPRIVDGTYSYFDFDYDGTLYIHHSLARILKQNNLTGLTFYPVITDDQDLFTYKFFYTDVVGRVPSSKVVQMLGCGFNQKTKLFSLTREDIRQGKKKMLYDILLNKRPGQNGIKEEQESCEDEEPDRDDLINEFSPSSDAEFTKWMTVDIPLVPSVESEKNVFSSEHRTCPHCGKVYPYLVSLMHLKKEKMPKNLDFFRTESNHIIISKKVLDVFKTQGKGLIHSESYCEPVIIEETAKK